MLKGVTNTFKEHCNNIELTYNEYIVIEGQTIPVRAKLSDDCYDNGNFVGSFILKTIQFETSNDVKFRNKEFEYYNVVDGESIKIGTFITTEITDNDTTELVKVVGMDYGLKTQVEYTSSLDYSSGNVTLLDVWNEACELSGIESGVDTFENADFIVDSDQFTGTGAMIRDVFIGIALSSGSFIKVMNDDKIYPIFKAHTESLSEVSINTTTTLENVLEIDEISELKGDTQQDGTPTPDTPVEIQSVTGLQNVGVCGKNLFDKNLLPSTWSSQVVKMITLNVEPNTKYTMSSNIPYGGTVANLFLYDESGTGSTATNGVKDGKNVTVTSSSTGIIKVGYRSNLGTTVTRDDYWYQLEVGSTATSYEPYKGKSYEINLGKNLFDKTNITTGKRLYYWQGTAELIDDANYCVSDYIKIKPNAIYTINLTMSAYTRMIFFDNNKSPLSANETNATFTTPNNTAYVRLSVPLNQLDTTQLEKGSQVTSYSEYFTPIELNKIGNYQDSIKKSTGKNLFDKSTITTGKYIDASGNLVNDNSNFVGDYIPIDNTKSYYASQSASGVIRVGYYNSNKTFISRQLISANYGSLTIPNNAVYVRLSCYNQSLDTLQLELGNQQTSYEPYGKVWYITKNITKTTLTQNVIYPSLNISVARGNQDMVYIYTTLLDSTAVGITGYSNKLARSITELSTGSTINYDAFSISKSWAHLRMFIKKTELSGVSWQGFREFLTNNPIDIWYITTTPTYTEITNTELINQLEAIELLKGENNITITSEDLTPTIDMTYWNNDSEVIEDYTDLEDKRDTHPWTCVRLGLSQVDGENVDLIDEELVEEYGENWLILNDNPFAYNQSKREQLITAIFNKVKGFGYSSFVSKTSFKPYLTCGDTVKFKNKNGDLIDSILLRYTHEFKENDMQITLEAPSETTAEVKYIYPLNAIDLNKRTQIEVDKENVKITSLTAQASNIETNLANNYYTIDQANQLVQTAQTGLTNTFSEAGGNNIFRNTGLWFTQSDSSNPYEFWNGNVVKYKEENASNMSALLLQNNTLYQEQLVPNGNYTISFKYKKLITLATVKCKINDTEYILDSLNEEEFIKSIEVNSQHINVQFISDTNNSCEIYDLMVNAGSVKLAYSQNQNETTTETVNISKGITITSSDIETTFKANADGVRIYANNDLNTPKTKFTDKGTETDYLKVNDEAEVVDILIQRVGSHTWLTKI